jgi:hypothetical protein
MFVALIFVLYLVIIFIYLLVSFFIVYHLATYSIDSELRIVMLALFIIVSSGLLFSNLLLFFAIDWNGIISNIIT